MTWIDLVIAVLLALVFNLPVLFLYLGTAFYFYFLNGYTFKQDWPENIKWSETVSHVPDVEKTTNLLCKKGCCTFPVREYEQRVAMNGHKN